MMLYPLHILNEQKRGKAMAQVDSDQLQTLDRGLDILMRMVHHKEPLGVGELSTASGYNKSTTFRILRTLQKNGFVSQLFDGKYEVRVETFQMIMNSLSNRINLQRIARGELEKLACEVNETVTLSGILNREVQCLDKVDSTASVHVTHLLGRLSPMHVGASGKAILAYLEPEEQENYLTADNLRPITNDTIADRELLLKDLEWTRQHGYSKSQGELDRGVSAVAAPVFNQFGRVIGSITIMGFSQDFTKESSDLFGNAVKRTAAVVSEYLGHSSIIKST
jgi:DNA-binding IclR family transcriptional regulator